MSPAPWGHFAVSGYIFGCHTGGVKEEKQKAREEGKNTQLNAEFHRIARREKMAFLNEQYKEIEENNRRGKTRNHFNKIGNIKGNFHPKMGKIKNRNCKDLIEAEEIKMRWKEYREEM